MAKRTGTETLRKRLLDNGCWIECAGCSYGAETDDWSGLEIAHVIPHSVGGSDDIENLVILCKECHLEAPNTTSVEFFHEWLQERRDSLKGPGAIVWRLFAEFLINPPDAYKELEKQYAELSKEERTERLTTAVRKANDRLKPTHHYGALAGWNYSTTKAMALETLRHL